MNDAFTRNALLVGFRSDGMKNVPKVVVLALLIIVAGGALLDPYWWYRFFYERQYGSSALWGELANFAIYQWGWWIVFSIFIIFTILILERTNVPDRLLAGSTRIWRACTGRWSWVGVCLVLASVFVLALVTAPQRSRDEQKLARTMADTNEKIKKLQEQTDAWAQKDKAPLSEPTLFVFLDTELVDSLYGQYEPELMLAAFAEESNTTDQLKGEVRASDFLSTSVGREQYQKRLASYKAVPKNAERKLKDVIAYFHERHLLTRFGSDLESQSDELKSLDQATHLLTSKYGIVVNRDKLRELRDKLFADQLAILDKRLTNLKGLVLVEGDWSVQVEADSYRLRRVFAENVSNPAFCEIRLRKDSVAARGRDILENLGGKPLRLSVFGNVLVGISDASRTVQLTPIAIY